MISTTNTTDGNDEDEDVDFVWNGELASIADYDALDADTVLLKLVGSNYHDAHNHYFIMYNRAKGINVETQHAANQVAITKVPILSEDSSSTTTTMEDSYALEGLSAGDNATDLKIDGKLFTVEVCQLKTTSAGTDVASISIYSSTSSSGCPDVLSSVSPTNSSSVVCEDDDQFKFTMLLRTDSKPLETSWILYSFDQTFTIDSPVYNQILHTYEYATCLQSDTIYAWRIMDSGLDGIQSKSAGQGYFSLFLNDDTEIESGGKFGSYEEIFITAPCQQQEGYSVFRAEINTDYDTANETTWTLESVSQSSDDLPSWINGTDTTVNFWSGGPYANHATQIVQACVPEDLCYNFTIFDRSGDGFEAGEGSYEILLNDEVQRSSSFLTGFSESTLFGSNNTGCASENER